MLFRLVSPLVLTWLLTQPQVGYAQVSLADLTRAIRIGSAILDATDARGAARAKSRPPSTSGRTVSSRTARRAVDTGDDYVGVPYVWGGSTPRGFDCSGFVQYVYRENGVALPRTSRQMSHAGVPVSAKVRNLREGDLMLFRGRNGVI